MTISESKGRFFYKTNRFESIRITNRIDSNREQIESIRIANWNALAPGGQKDKCSTDTCVKL